MISKKLFSKDINIINGIDDKNKEFPLKNYLELYFHEIKKITTTYYGFILEINSSNILYVINCMNWSEK